MWIGELTATDGLESHHTHWGTPWGVVYLFVKIMFMYDRFPLKTQAINVSRFREEMDRYLACCVEEISKNSIGKLMRHLIHRHLGWVIVWGCVFGVITGLVTQGVRLSLNFNFKMIGT